jgi:hypothetical protein
MRQHLKYAAMAGILLTPIGAVGSASATSGRSPSSAFGISASGPLSIPRTPSVSSASRPNTKSLTSLPGNPPVQLAIVRTRATPGHAEASVVDLRIAKAAIIPTAVLSAKLITAGCDGGSGRSRLVDVRLAGRSIQAGASPNSRLTVPVQGLGGMAVTINKQVRNGDGTLTVTALELAVQALGKSQTIDISSVTCAGAPGEAPKPTPVPSDLPVTG